MYNAHEIDYLFHKQFPTQAAFDDYLAKLQAQGFTRHQALYSVMKAPIQ